MPTEAPAEDVSIYDNLTRSGVTVPVDAELVSFDIRVFRITQTCLQLGNGNTSTPL